MNVIKDTLKDTKSKIFTRKKYEKQPRYFYMRIPLLCDQQHLPKSNKQYTWQCRGQFFSVKSLDVCLSPLTRVPYQARLILWLHDKSRRIFIVINFWLSKELI